MRLLCKVRHGVVLLVLSALWSTTALAQVDAASESRLRKLEQSVVSAQSAGDNAWMLTSSALVLMMTGPGLALFYGGLVRRKNVLATMMQSFILMAVVSVVWALVRIRSTNRLAATLRASIFGVRSVSLAGSRMLPLWSSVSTVLGMKLPKLSAI